MPNRNSPWRQSATAQPGADKTAPPVKAGGSPSEMTDAQLRPFYNEWERRRRQRMRQKLKANTIGNPPIGGQGVNNER